MRTFSKLEKSILRKIVHLSNKGKKMISADLFLDSHLDLDSQLYVIEGKCTSITSEEGISDFCKIEILGKAANVYKDFFEVTQRFLHITDFLDYLLKEGYLVIRGSKLASSFYLNKIENIRDGDPDIVELDLKITPPIRTFLEKCSYYYAPTDTLIQLAKNNFTSGQINFRNRKLSIAAMTIYLFGWPLNWGCSKSQQTNHRPIKLKPHQRKRTDEDLNEVKKLQEQLNFKTDLVYLSMLED